MCYKPLFGLLETENRIQKFCLDKKFYLFKKEYVCQGFFIFPVLTVTTWGHF